MLDKALKMWNYGVMEAIAFTDPARLYQELATFLIPYRNSPPGSHLFVVEGTAQYPLIALRYPGRKVVKRTWKTKTKPKNFIEWANALDFEVVAFKQGVEIPNKEFTYSKVFEDFYKHKMRSDAFWNIIQQIYDTNTYEGEVPELPGIDSKLFLLMLKWMWIQEDLNYRLSAKDIDSPIPYRLQTLKGSPTKNGAGRARFYASLFLLRSGKFPADIIHKIVTPR